MPKRVTMTAAAKQQRRVAAKVASGQRASAVRQATGRVTSKVSIGKPARSSGRTNAS
jgi:hypothetical protein